MKVLKLLLTILFASFVGYAQSKKVSKNAEINFEASVPSFEEVKAKSKNGTAIINTENGEFATIVLIKSFQFRIALMQEHFNENYMESDKYPKAAFKGKIQNFDNSSLSETPKKMTLTGKLTIHGRTNDISVPVTIVKKNNSIELSTTFKVQTDEYDIKIPSIISTKVARTVTIDFNASLN